MFLTAVIVIALVILSGLIAYLGDQVGRHVGKKKLSLFGLRPRITSIIVTVITGILIAAISVSLLLAVSSNLRMAVFNLQGVLSDLAALSLELRQRDSQLQSMEGEIEQTEKEMARIQRERTLLEEDFEKISHEYQKARTELINVREELDGAIQEIEELEKEREELQEIIGGQNEELEELFVQRSVLESKVSELEDKTQTLEMAYDLMEEEYQKRLEELRHLYQSLGERYQEYSEGDIIYLRGDEIHWTLVEGRRSDDAILEQMESFIEEANEIAQSRGLEEHDPDTGRSIVFYSSEFLAVARELREREGRFIMRLIAENNAVPGEHLRARFQLIPDYIVYEEGETILTNSLEDEMEPYELERWLEQIFTELQNTAMEEGVLPDAYGQLGTIDFMAFYELLDELQRKQGPLELSVIASEDIWRSDSLNENIGFRVVNIGDGGTD